MLWFLVPIAAFYMCLVFTIHRRLLNIDLRENLRRGELIAAAAFMLPVVWISLYLRHRPVYE